MRVFVESDCVSDLDLFFHLICYKYCAIYNYLPAGFVTDFCILIESFCIEMNWTIDVMTRYWMFFIVHGVKSIYSIVNMNVNIYR